jgi:uncharacterized membrane protein
LCRLASRGMLCIGGLSRSMVPRKFPLVLVACFTLSLAAHGQPQTPAPAQTQMTIVPGQAQKSATLAQAQHPPVPAQTQKPSVGPAAPQSRHFPVLLLAVGMNPSWSLRIGPNGPERLDRPAYPPITLEPAEITQEAPNAWIYHAKDTGTGAALSVLLSRDACSDGSSTKYSFKAVAQHPQLGTLNGCARIAAELYPRQNQQDDTDDDTAAKKKTPPLDPSLAGFKMPVDVAYVTATQKVVLRHGAVPHVVASEGSQLSLSHDGKRLLYTRGEKEPGGRAIMLYEATTGKSTELLTGDVQQPFWCPDETRFAFLKMVDGTWHLWLAPVAAPATATAMFPGTALSIQGWADAHTILVDDLQQLSWVRDDGAVQRTLPDKEVYGDYVSSGNTVRIHPQNQDLLLVSTEMPKRAPNAPTVPKEGTSTGFFLYEIAAKRRVILSPADMLAANAIWSRDGLQIFFTGTDASRRTAIWRMFWDGSDPKRYLDGRDPVIGQ